MQIWKVSALATACLLFTACGGDDAGAPHGAPLDVSPADVSLTAGATAPLTAAVAGSSNTAISWTVAEGSAGGTVSSSGLYTAPSTSGTYHVVATSRADPTKTATVTISVSAPTPGPTNPWALVGTKHLYVATTGSDSNPGTSSQPFRTVAHAASVATAGTIVHVAPGTYKGLVTSAKSGSSWSAPITFVSDQRGGAKIDGAGSTRAWSVNGSYIVIQGFEITCSTNTCYGGIHAYGSHYRVRGNDIHYTPPDCNTGGAGIQLDTFSATDVISDGNVVHDIWVGTSCGLTHGIYYASPNAGSIINNLLYHNSGWGIHLYHCAQGIVIANNTVMTSGHSGILVGSYPDCAGVYDTGTQVVNNIVTNSTSGCIEENNSGYTYNNTYIDNTCYGNGGSNTISLLPPPSGQTLSTVSGTLTTDPKFVNYQPDGSGDYRLQSTSPSANSGTTTLAPAYDVTFAPRPQGSAVDRGAYECW